MNENLGTHPEPQKRPVISIFWEIGGDLAVFLSLRPRMYIKCVKAFGGRNAPRFPIEWIINILLANGACICTRLQR
jgi:hypothetical protein